jgi:hypothetical protein
MSVSCSCATRLIQLLIATTNRYRLAAMSSLVDRQCYDLLFPGEVDNLDQLLDVLPRKLVEEISARDIRARRFEWLLGRGLRLGLGCFILAFCAFLRLRLRFRLGRVFDPVEVYPVEELLPCRAIKVELELEQRLQLRVGSAHTR